METPILTKYFKDPNELARIAYENGGLTPGSYGFLSGGFGGGVEMKDWQQLIVTKGYIDERDERHEQLL